jgi:hypothetical protein
MGFGYQVQKGVEMEVEDNNGFLLVIGKFFVMIEELKGGKFDNFYSQNC